MFSDRIHQIWLLLVNTFTDNSILQRYDQLKPALSRDFFHAVAIVRSNLRFFQNPLNPKLRINLHFQN